MSSTQAPQDSLTERDERSRVPIIKSVITPLNFLVLQLLVVEALLGGMATAFQELRYMLVIAIIVFIAVFTILVFALAIFRPEVLRGSRPWHENQAKQFADDLFASLEGPLSNLDEAEQEEAWITVKDIIINSSESDHAYQQFCSVVGERLVQRANLKGRWKKTRGTLSA